MSMTKTHLAALALGLGLSGAAHADHLELLCYETYDSFGRESVRVEVEQTGGRLTLSVYAESDFGDRLLKRAGVDERAAPGRQLDLLYVGRDLKLSLDSDTYEGRLELKLNGRTRRIDVSCD